MAAIKVKTTEDGLELWRTFKKVICDDENEFIEVIYGQYYLTLSGQKIEKIDKKTYFVRNNPDILAPDGTVLLPSKQRFTNWCNHISIYPMRIFFRTVINDTLESYPNLEDNAILPDYTEKEITEALSLWKLANPPVDPPQPPIDLIE